MNDADKKDRRYPGSPTDTIFVWVDYYEKFPTKAFVTKELADTFTANQTDAGWLVEVPFIKATK